MKAIVKGWEAGSRHKGEIDILPHPCVLSCPQLPTVGQYNEKVLNKCLCYINYSVSGTTLYTTKQIKAALSHLLHQIVTLGGLCRRQLRGKKDSCAGSQLKPLKDPVEPQAWSGITTLELTFINLAHNPAILFAPCTFCERDGRTNHTGIESGGPIPWSQKFHLPDSQFPHMKKVEN